MDDMEKKLFNGHIQKIDRKINEGLTKLKWSSKNVLEDFVRSARLHCSEIYSKLKSFKNNTDKIESKC